MSDHPMRGFARAFCDALAAREPARIAPLIHDDIDWTIFGPVDLLPFFGQRKGKAAVLSITGHDALLGGQPELDRLIRQRMPYVEPLNHVQIELIRRRRAGDNDPRVSNGILLAINGVAAGLRNSG